MAGRSSRSPAGTHSTPPVSTSPRIEEVLNMHTLTSQSPRAQRVAHTPNHPHARRSVHGALLQHGNGSSSNAQGDGVVENGLGGSGSQPIASSSAPFIRSTSRSISSNFTPRIVRGTIAERESAAAAPSSNGTSGNSRPSATSPPRVRRPSSTVAATSRNVSTTSATNSAVPPPSHVIPFPRPTYLEHSAMRHYIQSDTTSDVIPDRYRFDPLQSTITSVGSANQRDMASPSRDMDSDEESSVSTTVPPPRVPPRKPINTVLHLPTRWSDQDRYPSLSVSADGRELTFHGPNQGEKEAAAARTNFPAPAACGIYYYEIEVLNKGQKGHISIGFGTSTVRLSRLPGWEVQSWGYHGDDGNSFASERDGSQYGPKFTTGDVVGCGIDFSQGRAFFTKNGRYLGLVFENLNSLGDMYPSVGLRTQNEAIRANFGHEPFLFDINSHVEQEHNQTWSRVQETTIMWKPPGTYAVNVTPPESKGDDVGTELDQPTNELILAYLMHHGYAKTARAFKTQNDARIAAVTPAALQPSESNVMETDADVSPSSTGFMLPSDAGTSTLQDDTLKRQRIVHAIVDGDIDVALEETKTHYPRVLEREQGLVLFKLRCRKFIELVLDAAAALRDVHEEEARTKPKDVLGNGVAAPIFDAESMDVDDDGDNPMTNGATPHASVPETPTKTKTMTAVPALMGAYQMALSKALIFGQSLQADYKGDTRPDVQAIFKRTLSLVAYEDPLADDPAVPEAVKEMAGQTARENLAEEVNRAILESQGRPPHPALERLYRHTQTCIMYLGWLGVGAAAFADMPKEFLDF